MQCWIRHVGVCGVVAGSGVRGVGADAGVGIVESHLIVFSFSISLFLLGVKEVLVWSEMYDQIFRAPIKGRFLLW